MKFKIPETLDGLTREQLVDLESKAIEAFDATRDDPKLDAKGWAQLAKACEQLLNKIDSIEAESAKRIAKDPHAEGIVNAGLVIMLFEAARLAATEPKRRRARRPLKTSER